jgi:hypothetical protein
MKTSKLKTRTFRCTTDLDSLLTTAAESVQADSSQLLRDFVRQGSERILKDQSLQAELKRKYALA